MKNKYGAVLFSGCLWLAAALAHDSEALYLGNEGVLVSHGDDKVLFDAFYSEGHGLYVLVPANVREDLIAGRPPYNGIDAVFVSHVHGDHFSPGPTLDYLRAQPAVRLFASRQVIEALTEFAGADDPVTSRLTAFDLQPGDPPQSATIGEIDIDVVAIPHSGGSRHAHIRNLAFRATLGEWPTVLHLGDAETDEAQFAGLQAHWAERRADVAFPPYWFFGRDSGWQILENHLKADQVIGIHVPAEAAGHGEAWREQAGGDLFTDPGEARRIAEKECP